MKFPSELLSWHEFPLGAAVGLPEWLANAARDARSLAPWNRLGVSVFVCEKKQNNTAE